jgi:hypothetical protein
MYLYKTDMDNQRQLCEQIKKPTTDQGGGMTIFSIMFNVTDDELADPDSENIAGLERTGGKWIKDVFLGCASNKQFYFDISMNGDTNGSAESEIEKAYLGIASYLYKQRQVYNF